MQPTGTLHLGNYLGAIRNWVKLQDLYGQLLCLWTSYFHILVAAGPRETCTNVHWHVHHACRVPDQLTDSASNAAETFFCVVDMHAITLPHEPKALLQATRSSAATYIACGIDPDRANIFVQSHVSAHAELTWLLSCGTPIGWLRKMVQFKEKSQSRVRLLCV